MEATCTTETQSNCETCPARMVCHCLQVTEDALLRALDTLNLVSVKDICKHTGAGDGCTACHRRLRKYLEQRHALPMA
jgi:bacterioferritin-associated ferredoxin